MIQTRTVTSHLSGYRESCGDTDPARAVILTDHRSGFAFLGSLGVALLPPLCTLNVSSAIRDLTMAWIVFERGDFEIWW
jgi:hypothetical protein